MKGTCLGKFFLYSPQRWSRGRISMVRISVLTAEGMSSIPIGSTTWKQKAWQFFHPKMPKIPKLLVAGTFDQFHIGHQYFLWTAQNLAENMTIIIARDTTVLRVKEKHPKNPEQSRLERIEKELLPDTKIRLGRADGNFWETIREESPTAIFLGYDQHFDETAHQELFPEIEILRALPYFPEFFKSSKF